MGPRVLINGIWYKKLETQLGWVEKFGVKKPEIALSESRINEICRTWEMTPPD